MPKVVSRSAISTSADAKPTASDVAALRVYYCICGEFILVIEKSLAVFPQRHTDGAYIVRCHDHDSGKGVAFKLNANAAPPVLVERPGGHERQYEFSCPRCNLTVAYQPTPPPAKSGPYLYILKGALTQAQGQVPKDAFEGFEESQMELDGNTVHQGSE
ncbi:hypothetical protein SCLCIDRAFT_13560 [Scleroderma citrinum Foug A]|uniref:STEEP1 domain-containing protein n=1 Tax=Scleroderma citrinum Foug A TaxID=1036808 RepID=A0A0C3ELN1_9AGAM|nr:hypothetical protein SCLCIDRAFT_13560 [Scleroderma citrinum Foug A]